MPMLGSLARVAVLLSLFATGSRALPRRNVFEPRGIVEIIIAAPTGDYAGQATATTVERSYTAGQYLTWSNAESTSQTNLTVVAAFQQPTAVGSAVSQSSISPPAATQTTDIVDEEKEGPSGEAEQWLSEHNSARGKYGAKPLTWDEALVAKAKSNADLCSQSHTNTGENIAWISSGRLDAKKTLDMWMSEAPLYDWSKPDYDESWGHFTQIIWQNSEKVGCYVSQCGDGSQATCEYDPVGNYLGEFAANVKPEGTLIQ